MAASPSTSRTGGRSVTTTGVPCASASTAGMPKPSRCDGTTTASALAYRADSAASSTRPAASAPATEQRPVPATTSRARRPRARARA